MRAPRGLVLNVAFDDPEFWLLCPYDTASLGPAVIDTARRNHPFLCEDGVSQTSGSFPGSEVLAARFDVPLPDPPPGAAAFDFNKENLSDLRSLVALCARKAGLSEDRSVELVLAVNEIATNSLIHGGGRGSLLAWSVPGGFVCDIRDKGDIADPLVGRRRPSAFHDGGRGLWLANQLCELVQIRVDPRGNGRQVARSPVLTRQRLQPCRRTLTRAINLPKRSGSTATSPRCCKS